MNPFIMVIDIVYFTLFFIFSAFLKLLSYLNIIKDGETKQIILSYLDITKDYKRKQIKFGKCLSDMKKILDVNNQQFFLADGTLLGAYRDQKFIDYDGDIDLGIFYKKLNKNIKDLILKSNKFYLIHELGIVEDGYELSFRHKETGVPLDIFIFYEESTGIFPFNNISYWNSSYFGVCSTKKEGYCKWKKNINDSLKKYKFNDDIYYIPYDTEQYLTDSYNDWKTPKQFGYTQGLVDGYYGISN